MCQYFFYFVKSIFFECSRGKADQAAGEPVFCVINAAVFLRKILELFSMAKRQNFSMQPAPFPHGSIQKTLTVNTKISPESSMHYIFHSSSPRMEIYTICASAQNIYDVSEYENFMHVSGDEERKNF